MVPTPVPRPPLQEHEIDGKDYSFSNLEDMRKGTESDEYLETAYVMGTKVGFVLLGGLTPTLVSRKDWRHPKRFRSP